MALPQRAEVTGLGDPQVRGPTVPFDQGRKSAVGAGIDPLRNHGRPAAVRRNLRQVAARLWRLRPPE